MKRALSLIIVLAMVLCMIPFSAFAEANFNVAGDFVDGDIILDANDGISYLWTATETGTLEVFANPVVPEAVEGEEPTTLPEALIYINGAEYTEGGVSVVEGKSYEISFEDNNSVGGKVTVWAKFTGLPGTETNPYFIKNPAVAEEGEEVETSVTVPGNSTMVYCNLYGFAGQTVIVEGNGVKVTYNDNSYGSINTVDGVLQLEDTAEFEIDAGTPSATIKLINKSDAEVTYTFSTKAPVIGTVDNPQVITEPDTYTQEVAAGNQGYYYTYTAEGDGTVKVYVDATYTVKVTTKDENENEVVTEEVRTGWQYVIDKTYYGEIELDGEIISGDFTAYGDYTTSEQDGAANPFVVDVKAGNTLKIMVNTFNPDDEFNAPAGTVTTTIEFVAEGTEEPEAAELVLGDNSLLIANGATNTYTYTPESDGVLTATVTAMDPAAGMIGMIFGMGNMTLTVNGVQAMGPSVEANVTAGTPVEIVVSNVSMGQDETITLNLAVAEPAGPGESEETAVAIELPWEVTHTGEHDMYYTYTATEDCIVKVTSTAAYTLGISGVESKAYDSLTKYVELATGDTIIINTYSSEDCTYSASIVDALPAGNGSYYFPYVIENLPYTSDINNGDASLYYSYTAAKAATLVFSSENMGAVNVTLNGAWDVLDAENKLVVAAGDVVTINTYEGAFTVDYVPPVAVIGDAEYTTIDAAVAAAVSGDTITLVANATAEAGIVLPAGANLDLGTYTLTAPYVVAFTGSEIVGDVASAAIVASNLVAANVTISDVEYAWTANEGTYTLVEVVPEEPELPPVVEEPKVAKYNNETMSLTNALAAAAADYAADPAEDKQPLFVQLVADADMAGKTVTIPVGVALDVNGFDLTAEYLYVLNGGYITAYQNGRYSGNINSCSNINVARANLISSNSKCLNAYNSTMYVIPVWIDNCYVMANSRIAEESGKTAYVLDTEKHTVSYKFRFNGHQSLYDILKDSSKASDHAFKLCLNATWTTPTGDINLNFWVSDDFISSIASSTGTYCTFALSGLDSLDIDYSTFEVQAMVITDCGVSVFGPEY